MKHRLSRMGLSASLLYSLLVIFVFTYTAANTTPENVGYDWIPFALLSMPWYRIDPLFLIPGFVINAGLLYFLGAFIQNLVVLFGHRSVSR